jgi:hypothetical protein
MAKNKQLKAFRNIQVVLEGTPETLPEFVDCFAVGYARGNFRLSFAQLPFPVPTDQHQFTISPAGQLIFSPSAALSLHRFLGEQISNFQARFGKILE